MAIAKKDKFITKGIEVVVCEDSNIFPPKLITYNNIKLMLLGRSNKSDLINETPQYERSDKKGQFIYTNETGDTFDLCVYTDYTERVILTGIRTRLK